MTPSKSKTIAWSARVMASGAGRFLAGADFDLQAVRRRRIRTLVRLVVGARRVVGLIEVDRVKARRRRRNVEIPSRLVGVLARGQIGKRDEQLLDLPRAGG